MASAETLELVLLKHQKVKYKILNASVVLTIFAWTTVIIAATATVTWYLFFGPGFKDLLPPIHLYMIEAIAYLPAPQSHNELKTVLAEQGYVSIVQLNEITEMAKLEIAKLEAF
jgi:hypothetical protein